MRPPTPIVRLSTIAAATLVTAVILLGSRPLGAQEPAGTPAAATPAAEMPSGATPPPAAIAAEDAAEATDAVTPGAQTAGTAVAGTAPAGGAAAVAIATTPTREAPFEKSLPAPLRRTLLLDLRAWQWLALPALLVVALLLAGLASAVLRRAFRPAIVRTETTADDELLTATYWPLVLAFTVMFFAAGLPVLALVEPVDAFLRGLLKALGVLALSFAALRLIDVFAEVLGRRFEREGRRRLAALVPLGRRTAKIFLSAIAVVMLLQNVGLNVTGLLAGLGVGGIAVALAAQKTIENIFGGITVITDQPVRVGDLCRFRDGGTGTVEEIGLRSTRIRTPERTLITIPNADFAQRELENLAMRDRLRLYAILGLRRETSPDQVRQVLGSLRELLAGHSRVRADSVRIFLIGFGSSSLDVEISAYVETRDPDEFNGIREALLLSMMDLIEAAGAALAVPAQRIHLEREADADDRERSDGDADSVA